MKALTEKFQTYNPNKFMPVYEDGRLANKGEFYAYKAGEIAHSAGSLAWTAFERTVRAVDVMVKAINQVEVEPVTED